ncbi:MAG: hypothetical protein KDD61_14115 [Bdellovibrionales bacterium]|nr:hypothetical protein [Bdellovibrionales bacterium]
MMTKENAPDPYNYVVVEPGVGTKIIVGNFQYGGTISSNTYHPHPTDNILLYWSNDTVDGKYKLEVVGY